MLVHCCRGLRLWSVSLYYWKEYQADRNICQVSGDTEGKGTRFTSPFPHFLCGTQPMVWYRLALGWSRLSPSVDPFHNCLSSLPHTEVCLTNLLDYSKSRRAGEDALSYSNYREAYDGIRYNHEMIQLFKWRHHLMILLLPALSSSWSGFSLLLPHDVKTSAE